ncbi:MAG TPA: AlkA N-terminal domain-containing protein [Acetobacteraceae bacterium]|jgi:AraC family transcriptional regulator of adaptative response / DNA-3-methyladenine glycosylase II|nr:AlkA N-terminal domain-containing protein [Acetobacteraceae bacterium]
MDLDHDACYRALRTRDVRFDGRLFVAVKTTGIYCRPVCPARLPRPENVEFYSTAAAAQENGYRPCLRCRPETAPNLAAWNGTSSTVSRALALIEMGALDEGDIAGLAERLGVGARQLHRLFRQHLGASPLAVAQTRRILLAKQLIHETSLRMSEIALASGFGSIRRFNETFRQMYQRPPGTLRRGSGVSVSPGAAVTVLLRYRPPYDWPAMIAFLRARAIPGVEIVSDEAYARTIDIGGARGVVRVRPAPGNALEANVHVAKLSALPSIIARLRRVFDLAADPEIIEAHLSEDPLLAALVAQRRGLRVPGAWDGFELAVRAMLGQQITVAGAINLAGRLVSRYGERLETTVPALAGLTHVFPRPEVLAAADLSAAGMPKVRANALSALAATVAIDPKIFGPRRTLEEAIVQLRKLAGIGEWTAQYIAMRELREPDAFPAADIGLLRALAGADGRRPSAVELLARAERWRPWRAYAAQHLWASHVPARRNRVVTVEGVARPRRSPLAQKRPVFAEGSGSTPSR